MIHTAYSRLYTTYTLYDTHYILKIHYIIHTIIIYKVNTAQERSTPDTALQGYANRTGL